MSCQTDRLLPFRGECPRPAPCLLIGPEHDPPGESRGLPDVAPFRRGDWLYLYGTGERFARMRRLDPQSVEILTQSFDFGAEGHRGIWSLSVYEHTDGTIHGYGTIHYGDFKTEIGHFIPADLNPRDVNAPIRRWRLTRILAGNIHQGENAYDPYPVRDGDGRLYLLYVDVLKPDAAHPHGMNVIRIQRLSTPDTPDKTFSPQTILAPTGYRSEDRNPDFMQLVEGPRLYRLNGKYLLFYSVGAFDRQNYKMGVAWSDTMLPSPGRQYEKITIPDPGRIWGNPDRDREVCYLLQSQERHWPNYVGEQINGPGIGNLFWTDDGKSMLIFHGRPAKEIRAGGWKDRYVWITPVLVHVSDHVPPEEWFKPEIPPSWRD